MICYKVTDAINGLFIFLDESSGAITFSDCPFDHPANRAPKTYTLTGPEEVIYRVIIDKSGEFASYDKIEAALLKKGYYSEFQKGQATFVKMTSEVFSRRLKNENGFDLTTAPGKKLLVNSGKKYRIPSLKRCDEAGMDWAEEHRAIQRTRKLMKPGAGKANRFHYSAENTAFVGRDQEFDFLLQMCEGSDEQFSWIGICGNAGSGKSRLAFELCKYLEEQNWTVYYPCHARANIERITSDLQRIDRDTLICFDDTIIDMDEIINFIYSCAENPSSLEHKIRLVLIEREFGDSFAGGSDAFRYIYPAKQFSDHNFIGPDGFLYALPLTSDALASVMCNYTLAIAEKQPDDQALASMLDTLELIDTVKRPLFALFVADAWANGVDTKTWDRTDALEMVVKREFSKAFGLIKAEYGKKSEQSAALSSLKLLLVISSILKETARENVTEFVESFYGLNVDSPSFGWILNQLGLLSDDEQTIKQVFPDLISEYISIAFMNALDRARAVKLFYFLINTSIEATILFIGAAEKDYPDLLAAPCNLSALLFLAEELEVRIGEEISNGLSPDLLEEFDQIADPAEAARWLEKNKPSYCDIISHKYVEMKDYFVKNTDRVFHRGPDHRQSSSAYEGEFVFDWRCGKGIATYSDGSVYEGTWDRNSPNGQGKKTWPDGAVYDGNFKDGRPNGEGQMTFASGASYIGEWSMGHYDGFGRYQHASGERYEGMWANNLPNGYGNLMYENGDRYEGEFKDDVRSGHGKMIYSDGSVYEGNWKEDKRHGTGVFRDKGGAVSVGEWQEDKLIRLE